MADLIGRDVFPALKFLNLGRNPHITDLGVLALAEALTTQRCLRTLGLENVGLGDEVLAHWPLSLSKAAWSSWSY